MLIVGDAKKSSKPVPDQIVVVLLQNWVERVVF